MRDQRTDVLLAGIGYLSFLFSLAHTYLTNFGLQRKIRVLGTFPPCFFFFVRRDRQHNQSTRVRAADRQSPLSSFARAGAFDVTRSRQLLHPFKRYVLRSGSFSRKIFWVLPSPFSHHTEARHPDTPPPPPASRPQRSAGAPLFLRACVQLLPVAFSFFPTFGFALLAPAPSCLLHDTQLCV